MGQEQPQEYVSVNVSGDTDESKDLVYQAIEDAGRWAYGTVLVELWVLNQDSTRLIRPPGGAWLDPIAHSCDERGILKQLVDPRHPEFVPAAPLPLGVGLPGVLYSEASTPTANASTRTMDANSKAQNLSQQKRKVVWRDVNYLARDEDQPSNPRLDVLAKAGLGWAAAVPFHIGNAKGEVIYMARDHVDQAKLQSALNQRYLVSAADLIGSAFSLRESLMKVKEARRIECAESCRRAGVKLLSLKRLGVPLENLAKANYIAPDSKEPSVRPAAIIELEDEEEKPVSFGTYIEQKLTSTAIKCRGGGTKPPPPMNLNQALWTFGGVFLSLLGLTKLNQHMRQTYGGDYGIVLGPFGALMTLQYGLTAAPASQPWNAIVGQSIALTISLLVSMLDIELWLRQSIATALAVTAMVKLGITHPPAGAAALIFASGTLDWSHMLMMLVGNVIAIGTATIWNNLHDRRQYPTYFGFVVLKDLWKKISGEKDGKVE